MLFLAQADVRRLLDTDRLIEALAPAMAELSAGRVSMPARIGAEVPGAKGVLGVMPVYFPSAATPSRTRSPPGWSSKPGGSKRAGGRLSSSRRLREIRWLSF